ncbi:hypothetical protein N7490_004582 [Penicillium lividum]|nr:hypothetical protein N7490_004582 [Penicillium lividum]
MPEPRPVKPFGLTQVYLPRGDPTVDIVLVHGLNGHPHDSWTSKTTNCFWPVDLLPEVLASQRPRILTYGYNSHVTAFTDGASRDSIVSHAETLASNLAANRSLRDCSDRPIIFICHSLGGLVVKRALIYCRSLSNERTEHLRSIYVSTFGILFLGTPHNGSDIAKWGLLLHNICNAVLPKKFMESSPQLIQALRTNNETLQNINSLFADIMSRFHIYFFHETRSTDLRGTREIIVDETSAAPYIEGVERMGIEADHSHMCKFDDENAAGYEVVAEALLRYSRQAPALIGDRWIAERTTRTMEMKAKAREIYDDGDPLTQSTPNLNIGRTHLLPSPGRQLADCLLLGHSVPALPRVPATEGRNSPVSDMSNSGVLSFSHYSHRDPQMFVAPPGFHPNATFFGMQKELEVLHNRLFKAKARADRTMAVLISGVPGSGKTHLARQYVFMQRECYPGGVFWIDAKSRESSYKCFWEIAQAARLVERQDAEDPGYLEARTYVNTVRNWLQTRHEWLLIFDGIVFDHDVDINEFRSFLPWQKRCSIIYTSIDTTLRKKQRLFEPYCLSIRPLLIEDACKLLYKDLGIKKPTQEQSVRAVEIVEHYDCLPLAIHAIGHRLNATGKPIERYRVKHQVTDKKLAEPFLSIMNDLYRLQQHQALNLINLLSFLGHQVPVGLLNFGKHAMSAENAEILSSAQTGEDPDLDTTLGTLIHYGLIERISDPHPFFVQNSFAQQSGEEAQKPVPELSESLTESSQEGPFSLYPGGDAIDVVKIHSVVQGFCRDELRIKDEEFKESLSIDEPGFYDSWLIVATRFLCKSWEAAKERMTHYEGCGLVRDYREYETHASRLVELFPKRQGFSAHSPVLREARESLRRLRRSLSNVIDGKSPNSSQECGGNQRSVFDRSSSSSSSFPGSSTDEGISRESTWAFTDSGSPRDTRTESPEAVERLPRFKLELFPPHIFRQAGYESEEGYETDGEAKEAPRISPALSQMSQLTEKPKLSPLSSSPPIQSEENKYWQLMDRQSKPCSTKVRQPKRRPRSPLRLHGDKTATPLVKISPIQGRGSSSRRSADESGSSTILASAAERALAAVRRSSNAQVLSENIRPTQNPSTENGNGEPTYASVVTRRMLETEPRRPASMPSRRGAESLGLQMKPSAESLGQGSYMFASPLSHELAPHELLAEPLNRSTYSDPGRDYLGQPLRELDLHTAPNSQFNSRRASLAAFEPIRDLSASSPSLIPYGPLLPYENDITITRSSHSRQQQRASGPIYIPQAQPALMVHPSAIMPGTLPLSLPSDAPISQFNERPGSEALSRASSGFSTQSWATEPVRYPPRFSPISSFQGAIEISRSATPMIQPQQQTLHGRSSWTGEIPVMNSALQSDLLYPVPQVSNHRRVGSVDERLQTMKPEWDSEVEPAQMLNLGAYRVDVRDPRQRLSESGRLQAPRHVPTYQLYHPNMSGPLVQEGGHVFASAPQEVYGRRARSGSSPAHPDYAGLGVRFA